MREFQECFEEYGANYQATMGRFMGNEALYLRLLDMLFEDDSLQRLGDALDADDKNGAFEAAHTLKGVVGNLGLTPLYHALEKIVAPLRVGEKRSDYRALYQAIQSEVQRANEFQEKLKGGESK